MEYKENEISNNINENDKDIVRYDYEKISSAIEELAAKNPAINPQRVTMLKGIYQGDSRPIEKIVEELNNYSTSLNPSAPTIYTKSSEEIGRILAGTTNEETEESIGDIKREDDQKNQENNKQREPGTMQRETPSVELSEMFAPTTPGSAYYGLEQTSSETLQKPKQFVKTNETGSNEGGYADTATMAILTTTAVLSIITIVLAIAVLL